MEIFLIRPAWLSLLVLIVPAVWVAHYTSLVDLPGRQRRWSVCIRLALVCCLVAALAGCTIGWPTDRKSVLFLVDRSASVSPESFPSVWGKVREARQALPARDRSFLVYFAEGVSPAFSLDDDPKEAPELPPEWNDRGTDVAGALEVVLSNLEPDRGRHVVLFTDGLATGRDPLPAISAVAMDGVRLDVLPMPSVTNEEVQVVGVKAPIRTYVGQPFALDIAIQSTDTTDAHVQVHVNGVISHEESVRLETGENVLNLRQVAGDERMLRYRVTVTAEKDTLVDNNSGLALVRTRGTPAALLIEARPKDGRYLRWALKSEDIMVEVRSPRGIPRSLSELQQFDLLLFSDVPAHEVAESQMQMIRTYVRDLGGGFMMLGGEHSFGLGGYYKSVLEDILPVRTDFEREREHPSLAMVLVIDKSGSMGGAKIELAKEASKAASELLDVSDQLGVLAFDGRAHWVFELHSAADRDYISEKIGSLQPGGGTAMGPALTAAYQGLEAAAAKLKHVIALTDGHSSPANFYDLVSMMRGSGITVSTVGIGQGADRELLDRIANWGNGRHYFTDNPLSIPQIFAKETMTATRSALQETPFLAQTLTPHLSIRGIDFRAAPFLLGYVVTKAKPTGEVVLVTEQGHPLLVFWQYGLGQVGAYTSDAKNRWASEWLEWPSFSQFWAQVLRTLMRDEGTQGMQVRTEVTEDQLTIRADVPVQEDAHLGEVQQIYATVVGPDLKPVEVLLRPVAPERYEGIVSIGRDGEYHVQASRKIGEQEIDRAEAGHVAAYPEEFRIQPTDENRLRAWARSGGGEYLDGVEGMWTRDRTKGTLRIRLAPSLLAASLILLIADVLVRRVVLEKG